MLQQATYSDVQVLIINQASLYYLAALAVAIGFRMNLFNIGVDGQYRLAAMMTAVVGTHIALPGVLQVPLLLLVGMLTGAFWAGIAGVLKVTRGVSEVVATIMLNAIATSLIGYLTLDNIWGVQVGNNNTTGIMKKSGWVPGINLGSDVGEIYGLVFLAVLMGVLYWVVLNRTRFGFDLRATGASETAAAASGVDAKKMVLTAMLISGAVAGLRPAAAARRRPQLQPELPDRTRLHRHHDRPARPQQPGGHRLRRPADRLPRQGVPGARLRDPGGVREGDRHDHAGSDRLRGRHLLRGRTCLGPAPPAEAGR